MKNKNMIRTIHNVTRKVIFDKSDDARTFITLYDNLFYRNKDKAAWNHDGYVSHSYPDRMEVLFTIKKSDFDNIVRYLGLKKVTNKEWIYC
jgi:hypothetical protein